MVETAANEMLSPHQKSVMTPMHVATAKALFLALKPFAEERPKLPIAVLLAFLQVASREGQGVTDYSNEAEVWKTVMTRHLQDLGERDRHGGNGMNFLVQVHDRKDKRVVRAWITRKGAAFLDKAHKALTLALGR
jgi:DNA-binding MarR family transcriptional regulator